MPDFTPRPPKMIPPIHCDKCGGEARLIRRATVTAFNLEEVRTFECHDCKHQEERAGIRMGWQYGAIMSDASECRAHAEGCTRLGKDPDISMQRATALFLMSQTWTDLAKQTDKYDALVTEEGA